MELMSRVGYTRHDDTRVLNDGVTANRSLKKSSVVRTRLQGLDPSYACACCWFVVSHDHGCVITCSSLTSYVQASLNWQLNLKLTATWTVGYTPQPVILGDCTY